MACIDYMNPGASCPKKAVKLNHSLIDLSRIMNPIDYGISMLIF